MSIPFSAGSLVSNTEDMLKLHKGLLSGQVSSLDLLNKACTSATLSNGEKTNYGYGWIVNNSSESKVITHNGGINGFHAIGFSIIEDDAYVIILSNLPLVADIDEIAEQISQELKSNK